MGGFCYINVALAVSNSGNVLKQIFLNPLYSGCGNSAKIKPSDWFSQNHPEKGPFGRPTLNRYNATVIHSL